MTTSQLFDFANVFVLPFWLLMIVLPKWNITQKVMESYLPFVVLAGLYIYLFIGSVDPESAQALANPTLEVIAEFFSTEQVAATGWVHFLAFDLFVGRWIYWQGQKTGVWTIHSLSLCLFAGPMGLLSHIVTAWISKKFFSTDEVTEATS